MFKTVTKLKNWYERFERFNPVAFFFGGFTWDSLTLKRIDQILDNVILLTYLILVGVLIVLVSFVEKERIKNPLVLKYRKWYPLGLQFFLGGLFSAYVIFYFQSASPSPTSIFLGILILLLVANEFLEHRLTNIYLLIALYFLASFSFFTFFVPVVLKVMNLWTFILGSVMSLLLVYGLIRFIYKKNLFDSRAVYFKTTALLFSLFITMNLFYSFNWIPPIPLSLKTGGIYHHASRDAESGVFTLKFEKPGWYEFFKRSDDPFHYVDGDTVSCFTAVFAPTELTKKIVHHWQKYFPNRGEWITTDRLDFKITGYRDGGYRGITRKINVSEGEWRVNVETIGGLLLGRIDFEIKQESKRAPLKTIYR